MKWCSSVLVSFRAKKHLRISTRQWLGRSLYALPLVLWVLLANVKKVTLIREPKKNLVSQDQVIMQTS